MKFSEKLRGQQHNLCIRLTAKAITELDLVPSKFCGCTELFISHNSISSIECIDQFKLLTRLMIEYNQLSHCEDLQPLSKLQKLKELRLEGNPICNWPLWDIFVIQLCAKLQILNGKPVVRNQYPMILEQEAQILDAVYYLEISKIVSKSLRRLKKPQSKQISHLIESAMKKLPRKDFEAQVRTGSQRKDKTSYLDYLRKVVIRKNSEMVNYLPEGTENSDKFRELFSQLADCEDSMEDFTETARMLSACCLRGIGLQTNEKVTAILQLDTDNDSVQTALALASLQPRTLSERQPDPISIDIQYEPTLEIHNSSPVSFEEGDEYFPDLSVDNVFEYEHYKSINRAAHVWQKADAEELRQFEMDSASSEEDTHGNKLGLSFESQLQKEMGSEALQESDASFDMISMENPVVTATIPMSDASVSEMSSPGDISRISAFRARMKYMRDSINHYHVMEISKKPSFIVLVKFFKIWSMQFKKRVNKRMRRNMLSSSPGSPLMSAPESMFLSQKSERPPIPRPPSVKKLQYNNQLKMLVGHTIGSMLSDSGPRRGRSNSMIESHRNQY